MQATSFESGDALHDVLAATADAATQDHGACLALVVSTSGSTYVRAGAAALFASSRQVGWLSGGCLEPEIARRASHAAAQRRVHWMVVDTRDDEDMLSGSALGCRGALTLLLLPLALLPGIEALLTRWRGGDCTLRWTLRGDGYVRLDVDDQMQQWQLEQADTSMLAEVAASVWTVSWPAPPRLWLFGAGPETPALLQQLRALGWNTTLVERRDRWRGLGIWADHHCDLTPTEAAAAASGCKATLVMHHNFELDREALHALAGIDVPFIGLLGPPRRRDDLFRVLPTSSRDALMPRLHAPVGLPLGGHGPQAIALSIAAQLQAWLHGRAPALS